MNICLKHFVSKRLNLFSQIYFQKLCMSSVSHSFPVKNEEINRKHLIGSKTEEFDSFDPKSGDTFGALDLDNSRFNRLSSEDLPEDDDHYDVLEIKRGPKIAEIGYKKKLNQLINKRPIQMREALKLYNQMVSEDRIPPHKCTYSLMINGCAKVGFTQKAFELFDEMLKYELKPTKQTITSLFNACAECPFPEFGLQKARYLREWMSLEGFFINTFHYNSMIKAFGKLGDIQTSFQLINEMVANGQTTDEHTFAMLLMGCISDKNSGLFAAMQVFRRIKSDRIPVSVNTFNLLLKAIKECGIGSQNNLNAIIRKPLRETNQNLSKNSSKTNSNKSSINSMSSPKMNDSFESNERTESKSVITTTQDSFNRSPNQMTIIDVKFDLMSNPCNRFLLFGGMKGFIQMMIDSKVSPDIKTLTLITELIHFSDNSEEEILSLLKRFQIRADTDFFNILIKRLCFDKGLLSAKRVFQTMVAKGLQPNIMTFGVLSLGCNRFVFGQQLLKDMEELNIKPNIQIMGALVSNACLSNDFQYLNHLIDYMKANDIKPDQKLIEKLEVIKTRFQKMYSDYDWNKNNEIPKRFLSQNFRKDFHSFKDNYNQWIKSVILEEEDHPWRQFQFEEVPNKKKMHSFVKYMNKKIRKRRGTDEHIIHEFEEDELYNE